MEYTIVLVDDERIVLESLRSQLRGEIEPQVDVELAENASEATLLIEELVESGNRIVLILTDWLMPGMKGDEFLVQVHKRYPEIIKIMLTGFADEKAISRAKKEGGLYECVAKPWDRESLILTINNALKKAVI